MKICTALYHSLAILLKTWGELPLTYDSQGRGQDWIFLPLMHFCGHLSKHVRLYDCVIEYYIYICLIHGLILSYIMDNGSLSFQSWKKNKSFIHPSYISFIYSSLIFRIMTAIYHTRHYATRWNGLYDYHSILFLKLWFFSFEMHEECTCNESFEFVSHSRTWYDIVFIPHYHHIWSFLENINISIVVCIGTYLWFMQIRWMV